MAIRHALVISAGVTLLLGVGCGPPTQTTGQLVDRLDSAAQIGASGPRQSAMADIARAAARSGQPSLCLRAVDAIQTVGLKDRVATDCAAAFNADGDRPAALALIGRLSTAALRDPILSRYATEPASLARYY